MVAEPFADVELMPAAGPVPSEPESVANGRNEVPCCEVNANVLAVGVTSDPSGRKYRTEIVNVLAEVFLIPMNPAAPGPAGALLEPIHAPAASAKNGTANDAAYAPPIATATKSDTIATFFILSFTSFPNGIISLE